MYFEIKQQDIIAKQHPAQSFQNYLNFTDVSWYENFLKKYNFTSSRKFAYELNKKMVNEEKN